MQRAMSIARALQALQKARGWSPEVCRCIMQWRGCNGKAAPAPSHISPQRGARLTPRAAQELRGAAAAEPPLEAQPQLPLCEREPRHAVPLPALLAWHEAARRRIVGVGDSWVALDEGPSSEDLDTELGWLLDDSLAAWAAPGQDWLPISWRQLERDLRQREELRDAACQYRVQLREPLEGLEAIWEQRLERRVPLQYLTATSFWRDVVLSVGPGVLIPRPETELMIDFVLEAAAAAPELATGAWADLGTGSGALAVGVARALPQACRVYAVDLHPVPLAFAAFNAARLGVGGRLTALQGSWFEPLDVAGAPQLAGVVSNPPYIPSAEMPGLQAEVGRHEPRLALHGGEGLGIDCLLPICTGAARRLRPGGFLALETAGGEQAHYIADLLAHMRCSALADAGAGLVHAGGSSGPLGGGGSLGSGEAAAFTDVRVRKDQRGVDRFVTATRAAPPSPASPADAA